MMEIITQLPIRFILIDSILIINCINISNTVLKWFDVYLKRLKHMQKCWFVVLGYIGFRQRKGTPDQHIFKPIATDTILLQKQVTDKQPRNIIRIGWSWK